jgi:hypothetical protein
MKKILPVIIFLSLGVVSLLANLRNSPVGIPGFDEFTSVSTPSKVELKLISTENSNFALNAKRSMAIALQNANALSTMLLDSIVAKNTSGSYTTKEVYFKGANDRDTLVAKYAWNGATSKWDMNQKNQLTHDSKGNITSSTAFSIYSGFVLGTFKYEASYDSNNNQTLYTTYTWVYPSTWVKATKQESTYTNGNETLNMHYSWVSSSGVWKSDGKTEYLYDGKGYLIREIDYKLNSGTGLLDNDTKYEFLNNASGKDTLATEYSWNNGAWEVNGKSVSAYNVDGRPVSSAFYQWDSNTSLWEGLFMSVYFFDGGGHLNSFIYYQWDSNLKKFVEYNKSDYSYDSNGYLSLVTSYLWNVNVWAKQSTSNYYYSPSKNTDVSEIDKGDVKVYPNPTNDFLYLNNLVNSTSVSIVDVSGRQVYNKQILENTIDVSKLKAGIYFMQINTGAGKSIYKFVKK